MILMGQQNIILTRTKIINMVMLCQNIFQRVDLSGFILMKFHLDKYDKNSSRDCLLQVELEYSQEFHKLHSNYFLGPNQLEIKREMSFDHLLKIADDNNVSIGNVKQLNPNFSNKEMHVLHYKNLQLYLLQGLKIKN